MANCAFVRLVSIWPNYLVSLEIETPPSILQDSSPGKQPLQTSGLTV